MALLYYRMGENRIGVLRFPFSSKEREQYLKHLKKRKELTIKFVKFVTELPLKLVWLRVLSGSSLRSDRTEYSVSA